MRTPPRHARHLGGVLARDGVSLDEALDGLRTTSQPGARPRPGVRRAPRAATAWSEATLGYLHRLSCEDPLTGLASLAAPAQPALRALPRPRASPERPLRHPRPGRGRDAGPATTRRLEPLADDAAPRSAPRPRAPSSPAARPSAGSACTGSWSSPTATSGSPQRVDAAAHGCSTEREQRPGLDRGAARLRRGRRRAARRARPPLTAEPSADGSLGWPHVRPLRLEPAPRGPRRGVRGRRRPGPRRRSSPTTTSRPPRRCTPSSSGRRSKDSPRAAASGSCGCSRWGLVPSWAKDPSIGNRMINARMETVAEKPAYRRAFAVAPVPAAGRRLLRVVPHRAADQGGQAAQAAVLHPAPGRRRAGDGRSLRDLARPDPRRGRPGAVPLDLHGAHHRGRGRRRPHPRPDAADGRAGALGGLARPARRRRTTLLDLLVPAAPGDLEAFPVSTAGRQRAQQRPRAGRAAARSRSATRE